MSTGMAGHSAVGNKLHLPASPAYRKDFHALSLHAGERSKTRTIFHRTAIRGMAVQSHAPAGISIISAMAPDATDNHQT
jgi:hypothetical protein